MDLLRHEPTRSVRKNNLLGLLHHAIGWASSTLLDWACWIHYLSGNLVHQQILFLFSNMLKSQYPLDLPTACKKSSILLKSNLVSSLASTFGVYLSNTLWLKSGWWLVLIQLWEVRYVPLTNLHVRKLKKFSSSRSNVVVGFLNEFSRFRITWRYVFIDSSLRYEQEHAQRCS